MQTAAKYRLAPVRTIESYFHLWQHQQREIDRLRECIALAHKVASHPPADRAIRDILAEALSDMGNPMSPAPPRATEYAFDLDIELLDKSIKSGSIPVPRFASAEEFRAWVNGRLCQTCLGALGPELAAKCPATKAAPKAQEGDQ